MIDRQKLLKLAANEHASAIFKYIKTASEHEDKQAYYNQLCRDLKIPSATVNRYLYFLEENHLIIRNWEKIEISETLGKDKRYRVRTIWTRILRPAETEGRQVFEKLLYG